MGKETVPNFRETIYLRLTAPFPEEAYGADTTRGSKVLTSLKAQFVVERLNEVFGLGNWRLDGEWKDVDDGILFIGELTAQFFENDKPVIISTGPVPGFAGTDKENSGDAYKSARTDCLSKSSSLLGIGNEMYKGNVKPRLSDAQKKALDVDDQQDLRSESAREADEVETNGKSKRGDSGIKASAKNDSEGDSKPKLRPARSFYRGSKLKPKMRENEENGSTSESTDTNA